MQKAMIKQLKQSVLAVGNTTDRATQTVTLALSVSDHRHRAKVQFIRRGTFNQAWQVVADNLAQTPQQSWVRIEVVQSCQRLARAEFEQRLAATFRMNYWRDGISFDADFQTALLEMEINGQAFFRPSEAHRIGRNRAGAWVDYDRVVPYLTQRQGSLPLDVQKTEFIWIFTTAGIFTDGEQIWQLSDKEDCGKGIRVLTNPQAEIKNVIEVGETYLINQIKADGKFIYGYYPSLQKVLSNYNCVRHFSSLYALLEAIEFTGRTADYAKVKLAIEWGLKNATIERDGALYIDDNGELKLGGQALLLLTLCKYQSVTGDKSFEPVLLKTFKGVPAFRQADGKLVHVLNTDLSLKSAYRIIYYEGEIVFALSRLYELTHNQDVMVLVQEILDYMVAHDYGKYHDHWISYAINEALQVFPDRKDYMALGLKNVFIHLKFIAERDTTYPTLLELVNAAVRMTDMVKASGNDALLEPYDLIRLRQVFKARAEYEVTTGQFLPEIAMYLYHPQKFIGGFYARHDNFRTRIDDCEHFLSGLINYYNYTYK
ncbi:glycosyl transferase family 1 [Lactiplantibacillus sp. WILCCON 0030]|uniref:Glycosyl transferase family 1 n=1 Tax=Lactiplantibacillus brownii TaxID=3069269 RepID=A0ABU1AA57_9LACO|nr:glycosyl transferase family 1 [Lactiplantibacillus brownii]MDQ7937851.1 glycosyl transferase family 1 [Lactiplantibacillus brownii]